MPHNTSKHSAQHSASPSHPAPAPGRLPHGFGGLVSRAVRGAVHEGNGRLREPVRGALRGNGLRGVGGALPQSAPNDLAGPAAEQLKILQDIYNLMTGA